MKLFGQGESKFEEVANSLEANWNEKTGVRNEEFRRQFVAVLADKEATSLLFQAYTSKADEEARGLATSWRDAGSPPDDANPTQSLELTAMWTALSARSVRNGS